MPLYEIRLLKDDHYSSTMIIEQHHIDDHAAVRAAARLAASPWFEVWRDIDCIYGLASGRANRNPSDMTHC